MQRINTQWMAGALTLGMMMAAARSNPVLQTWDFESGDLTGWNLVPATQGGDTLFKDGRQPVSHTRIGGKQGTWWIDTYRMNDGSQGDAFTGIIETDPFILPGNAEFTMISGGGTFAWSGTPQSPGAVAGIALEREVSPGTWENLIFQSGGANTLVARTWDAGAWAGETVRLRIYDNTTGGWGWTAVDNIVLTGVPIGVFSVPEVSDVTATAAQASVVTDTALDQARLLWDTTDKGTDDPADWTLGNLSLGAQAADATVSGQMTGLAADTLYTFRFYGEHDTETDWSLARTFATALTAAQTPVFSSAVSPGWYSVELTWLDNAATETGYVLQRSDSGSAGPYDVIATLAADTTSYTDTTVSATTTYHYRLAAVNADNESSTDPAACEISVTTGDILPPVNLTWDHNASGTASDGTGTWLNANQWLDGATPVTWNNFTLDNATIGSGGAGGTITLGTVVAGSVLLDNFTGTYTLNGGSLSQSGGITIGPNAGHVTINSDISGTGGVTVNAPVRVNLRMGSKTYSGDLVINAGEVLEYNMGGLGTGNLTLNGGVMVDYWAGLFNRTLGSGAGQVQVLGGASGFTGQGSNGLTVRLNNNAASVVVWGSTHFNPSTLVLQSPWANDNTTVTWQNPIDLNAADRTIAVNKASGFGVISGVISTSSGTAGLIKSGPGTLRLTVASTYNGDTTVNAGTLQFNAVNPNNEQSAVTIASGARLHLNFSGSDTVRMLFIGGTQVDAGEYGHTNSGATNGGLGVGELDTYFAAGGGKLIVTSGPPRGTVIMIR